MEKSDSEEDQGPDVWEPTYTLKNIDAQVRVTNKSGQSLDILNVHDEEGPTSVSEIASVSSKRKTRTQDFVPDNKDVDNCKEQTKAPYTLSVQSPLIVGIEQKVDNLLPVINKAKSGSSFEESFVSEIPSFDLSQYSTDAFHMKDTDLSSLTMNKKNDILEKQLRKGTLLPLNGKKENHERKSLMEVFTESSRTTHGKFIDNVNVVEQNSNLCSSSIEKQRYRRSTAEYSDPKGRSTPTLFRTRESVAIGSSKFHCGTMKSVQISNVQFVHVACEDIRSIHVDVIIGASYYQHGMACQLIGLAKALGDYGCETSRHMSTRDIRVFSPRHMSCKMVFNIKVEKKLVKTLQTLLQFAKEHIRKCLVLASEHGLKSIAIPGLFTSVHQQEQHTVIKCIVETVQIGLAEPAIHVENIYFCDNNENKVRMFEEAIEVVFRDICSGTAALNLSDYVIILDTEEYKIVAIRNDSLRLHATEVEIYENDEMYPHIKENLKINHSWTIVKILKVENSLLFEQYRLKKTYIESKNGSSSERLLWHGTTEKSVSNIIHRGFNRSYCGKNGTKYGKGVYFAKDSNFALSYVSTDFKGTGHIFLARVSVGKCCRGNSHMHDLPIEPGLLPNDAYDSACDDPSNPKIFVIFNDTQAYPAYHVILEKKLKYALNW